MRYAILLKVNRTKYFAVHADLETFKQLKEFKKLQK